MRFLLPSYSISVLFSNASFLIPFTQWAEILSRKPVTHSVGSESVRVMHSSLFFLLRNGFSTFMILILNCINCTLYLLYMNDFKSTERYVESDLKECDGRRVP